MEFKFTRIFEDNNKAWLDPDIRRCLNEGGTRSSKTYSILQLLILIAQNSNRELLISVVSESLPHLRRGAIRDFFAILGEGQDSNPYWNKSVCIYKRPNWKGYIEFFGADESSKLRGAGRQILFINEANNVPYNSYMELDIRTELFTFLDWNPVSEFWAHENLKKEVNNAYVHSTYLDAIDVLPRVVVENIESNKDKDPNWWNVYGLGLLGKIEGLVYPLFKQIGELPDGEVFYGLDYGFSSDPTVLVGNVINGDNLYSKQIFYKTIPLTNDDIAREMELLKIPRSAPIYPDPSEPKSAEEIRKKGFNVQDTERGKGSKEFGIKRVNQYYQHWTKDSVECIKEQRNYRFILKREPHTGREYLSDDTSHQWSHGMDARRYAVASHRQGIGNLFPSGRSQRRMAGISRR